MPEILVAARPSDVPVHVAEPAGQGPWPAVVVLHDVFGMDDDVRAHAEWLAGAGFLAAAPDLYHWSGTLTCVRSLFKDLRARRGRAFDDVESVRAWLASDPRCTGKVGVVGFCVTGGFALLLAGEHGFAVSSVSYGDLPADLDQALRGACPIVASYGGRDPRLRGAAARLEGALESAGVPHDVKEYPGARHGFMNRHANPLWRVAEALGGVGHDAEATEDARSRMVAFLSAHLGTG